jgi:hypothetical protein
MHSANLFEEFAVRWCVYKVVAVAVCSLSLASYVRAADDAVIIPAASPETILDPVVVEATPLEVEAKPAPPKIGSWLNTPPQRQAIAFDLKNNRLYFDADGKVVGRYNRAAKQFEAGDFRPVQWHNIAVIDDPELSTTTASTLGGGKASGSTTSSKSAADKERDWIDAKPAEVYRRGQPAGQRSRGTRAKVIESFVP